MYGGHFRFGVGEWLYMKRSLFMYIYLLHIPFVLQKSIPFNLMAAGHTTMIISLIPDCTVHAIMYTQVKCTDTDPDHQSVDS